jgi:hypothetical protein
MFFFGVNCPCRSCLPLLLQITLRHMCLPIWCTEFTHTDAYGEAPPSNVSNRYTGGTTPLQSHIVAHLPGPLSTLLESGLGLWQPLGPGKPEEASNSQQHCRTSGTGGELNP